MKNKKIREQIDKNKVNESNPTKGAMRFDENKMRFDLIPIEALIELARVYSIGAIKYEDDNWRKGMKWSRCIGSLERHMLLWRAGVAIDEDTKCHHLAMVAWNALTLLVYEINKIGTDDRIKLNINSKFNWEDNHLSIGMKKEELEEFKNTWIARKNQNKRK